MRPVEGYRVFLFNPYTGKLDLVGSSAGISSSKILPLVGTIAASSTGTIDTLTYSGFLSCRYFCALQSASGKTASFDYSITTDGVGGVLTATFGKISGGISYSVDTSVVSGNILFKIVNNETDTMTWKMQKLGF